MQMEFIVTRTVLATGALAIGLTVVLQGERLIRHQETIPLIDAPAQDRPEGTSWQEELLASDIQTMWRERRLLLEDLSRRYRNETDDLRRAAFRREMEHVIKISEREIYELRLRNARRAGNESLAIWLEHARKHLPVKSPNVEAEDRHLVARF